jgi:hypothetical protein
MSYDRYSPDWTAIATKKCSPLIGSVNGAGFSVSDPERGKIYHGGNAIGELDRQH